jgi:hypothetical protein
MIKVELVPRTSWYSNIRSSVSTEEWDMIRRDVYRKAGHQCEICQAKGMVHCHETWEYDDKNHIQKLVGLICLCPPCHNVKHIGYAALHGKADDAIKHLMKINNWTLDKSMKYISKQFDIWQERSKNNWTIDISYLDKEYGIKSNGNKVETK